MKNKWINGCLVVYVFLSIIYCINFTFLHDDSYLFFFRGRMIIEDIHLWDIIKQANAEWVVRGRVAPVALVYTYVVYYLFPAYIPYELFIILETCIDVLLFGYFVRVTLSSDRCEKLAIVLMPCFFQVYSWYHNALLGYAGLLQFCVFLVLLQLIFFVQYLKSNRVKYIIASLIMQTVGALTYEFMYFNIIYILIVMLAFKTPLKKVVKIGMIYLMPILLIGLISLYNNIKSYNMRLYEGSRVSLNVPVILSTYFKQVVGAIPLTHFWFARFGDNLGLLKSNNIYQSVELFDIFVVIAGAVFLFLCITPKGEERHRNDSKWLLILGLSLWLIPPVLIALSEKYQNELFFGISHICVFLEYFGVAYVVVYVLKGINNGILNRNRLIQHIWRGGVLFIFSFVMMTNLLVTKTYMRFVSDTIKYPKQAVIEASKVGFFDDIDKDDVIYIEPIYQFDNAQFFTQTAEHVIQIVPVQELLDAISDSSEGVADENGNKPRYIVKYDGDSIERHVYLGKIDKVLNGEVYVSDVRIYDSNGINVLYCANEQGDESVKEMIGENLIDYSMDDVARFSSLRVE